MSENWGWIDKWKGKNIKYFNTGWKNVLAKNIIIANCVRFKGTGDWNYKKTIWLDVDNQNWLVRKGII